MCHDRYEFVIVNFNVSNYFNLIYTVSQGVSEVVRPWLSGFIRVGLLGKYKKLFFNF